MVTSSHSNKDNDLRKAYLNNASRYLFTESLSSSAYIMAQSLELSGNQHTQKSSPVCQACGTILVPGFTSRKSTSSRRTTGERKSIIKAKRSRQAPSLITKLLEECLTCGRSTSVDLPSIKPIRVKKYSMTLNQIGNGMKENLSRLTTDLSSQTSHRKRKKHKGLLRKSKEEAEEAKTGSGLDLMDFMRAV